MSTAGRLLQDPGSRKNTPGMKHGITLASSGSKQDPSQYSSSTGTIQEEDCMQDDPRSQEEEALSNHRNVGLDQVITSWPNLLNASLYPK